MTGEAMQTTAWLTGAGLGFTFAFGLVIGSFLNVVIHRLPLGQSIVKPGSHCPSCNTAIKPWDNVPVLSYLWLGGRCRQCRVRISPRYPAVELLTGCVFAAIAWRFGASPATPVLMLFAAGLIAAALIDLDHRIIPDEISLGGLALGLALVPAVQAGSGGPLADALGVAWGGALVGGGVLWSVAFLHARLSAAMGREFEHWPGEGETYPTPGSLDYWIWFPGMGFGDIKLLAMIGAFLGPWGVLQTIIAASLAGIVMGVGWALATRSWSSPFGFGPAIALGALLVVLVPFFPSL
ncbi:MAG: prepilin peptidase [Proteobacteria bacterium]|nr:prepilin peptidase [Pseudomonadota bacterium]